MLPIDLVMRVKHAAISILHASRGVVWSCDGGKHDWVQVPRIGANRRREIAPCSALSGLEVTFLTAIIINFKKE